MVQSREPTHFVNELVTVRRLAVWKIATDHTHIAEIGCDDARHVVFETRNIFDDLCAFDSRDKRHTIVGFLTKPLRVVTRLSESCKRKFVIGHFEFLQSKHIDGVIETERLLRFQPVNDLRQPDGERVDIPRSKFHGN